MDYMKAWSIKESASDFLAQPMSQTEASLSQQSAASLSLSWRGGSEWPMAQASLLASCSHQPWLRLLFFKARGCQNKSLPSGASVAAEAQGSQHWGRSCTWFGIPPFLSWICSLHEVCTFCSFFLWHLWWFMGYKSNLQWVRGTNTWL